MINIFKLNFDKIAQIINNPKLIKQAADFKSLDRLQADLDYERSLAKKTSEAQKQAIINFLSNEDVRRSLSLIIITDPSLKFSNEVKSEAATQILGLDEKRLEKFINVNTQFLEEGSSLKQILVSLLSSKQVWEKPTIGDKIKEITNTEKGEGGVVYQPEADSAQIGKLVQALSQQLGDLLSDEDEQILSSQSNDKQFYKVLLKNLQKIAAEELNPHFSANLSYLDSLLDKFDEGDSDYDASFEKQFNTLIAEYRSKKQFRKEMPPQEFFELANDDLKRLDIIGNNLKEHLTKQKFYRLSPFYRKDIQGMEQLKIEDEEYLHKLENEYKKVLFHASILLKGLDTLILTPELKRKITLPRPKPGEGKFERRPQIEEIDMFKEYVKLVISSIDEVDADIKEFKNNLQFLSEKFFESPKITPDYIANNLLDTVFFTTFANFLEKEFAGKNEDQLKTTGLNKYIAQKFMSDIGGRLLIPKFKQLAPYFKKPEVHPQALTEATMQIVQDELERLTNNALKKQIASFSDPMLAAPIEGSKLQPGMEWYPETPKEMEEWKTREQGRKALEEKESLKESSLNYLINKYASRYNF